MRKPRVSTEEQRKKNIEYQRVRRQDPEKRKHDNLKTKEWHRKQKQTVMDAYGGFCVCCGESRLEFLTIDHIEGNGRKHREEIKDSTGKHLYRWLVSEGFPEGFRVLCWNCNCAKGKYGYCPHRNLQEDKE